MAIKVFLNLCLIPIAFCCIKNMFKSNQWDDMLKTEMTNAQEIQNK